MDMSGMEGAKLIPLETFVFWEIFGSCRRAFKARVGQRII